MTFSPVNANWCCYLWYIRSGEYFNFLREKFRLFFSVKYADFAADLIVCFIAEELQEYFVWEDFKCSDFS